MCVQIVRALGRGSAKRLSVVGIRPANDKVRSRAPFCAPSKLAGDPSFDAGAPYLVFGAKLSDFARPREGLGLRASDLDDIVERKSRWVLHAVR